METSGAQASLRAGRRWLPVTAIPSGGFVAGLRVALLTFPGDVGARGGVGSSGLNPRLLLEMWNPTPEAEAGLGLLATAARLGPLIALDFRFILIIIV